MKDKIYFFKTLILIGILFILIISLNQFYLRFVDNEGARFSKKYEDVHFINTGSSHGKYGIIYQNKNGVNLANDSQTFYYDYKLLKKYSYLIKKGVVVILPIDIFSFYSSRNIKSQTSKYVGVFPFKDLICISKKDYYIKKLFRVINNEGSVIELFHYMATCIKRRKIYSNIEYEWPRTLSPKNKEKDAILTSKAHLGYHENPDIAKGDLKKILNLINTNGGKAVFIITPESYLYNKYVSRNNYKTRIYNNLDDVTNKLDNKIPILDYSHDKRFENNLDLFADDDHLNKNGAIKFSRILFKDINKLVLK